MKRLLIAIASCFFTVSAYAAYTYYYSENLYTPNWSNWTNVSASTGYYSTGGYGGLTEGKMLYNGSTTASEVKATVRLATSASSIAAHAYLRVVTDYNYSVDPPIVTPFYSYYDASVYATGSGSTGYVSMSKTVGGSGTTSLNGAGVSVHDGMIIRAFIRPDGIYGIYLDNVLIVQGQDTSISSGQSGIGMSGSTTPDGSNGNLMSHVDLGPIDSIAPNAIPAGNITYSAFANHIDLAWTAATDDTNGIGILQYQILRDGSPLATVSSSTLTFSDTTVVPAHTYTYTIKVYDQHLNTSNTNKTISTPAVPTCGPTPPLVPCPSVTPDGRRVGVRSTGAYWGAGNEQIDLLSGNLNFTLPLLKAQGRGGWSVPFSLAYNSENWRTDSGGQWKLATDVGYGFGWKLLAGSVMPVYSVGGYTPAYYLFIDSSGAEYKLDQNSGNIWTSKESIYVSFDASSSRLYFRDGARWDFGCVSAGTEADAGVMYPTMMQDTNGNRVMIRYQTAAGAGWTNSSARITQIEDVRAINQGGGIYATYAFTYGTTLNGIPHLTAISNSIGTGEAYSFTYLSNQTLQSPFSPYPTYGTTNAFLSTATVTGLNMTHQFYYQSNNSGEMQKISLPYGGYIAFSFQDISYPGGLTYREVNARSLAKDGINDSWYSFWHDGAPTGPWHLYTLQYDPNGIASKLYVFGQSGPSLGLVTGYEGRHLVPNLTTKVRSDMTWTLDGVGNSYIASTVTTNDPGQSYSVTKKTEQTVDNWGNLTQQKVYDYGNLSTPARTYNYGYVTDANYTSRYMHSLYLGSSVTPNGGSTVGLDGYGYDSFSTSCNGMTFPAMGSAGSGIRQFDAANYPTTFQYRGNVTAIAAPGKSICRQVNQTGVPIFTNVNGVVATSTTDTSTNYTAPSAITTGSLTNTMSWNSFLGLTSASDPNGATVSSYYDSYARSSGATSPFGASTSVGYNNAPYSSGNPATVTATTNGRWSRSTLDGLGRPIKVETGNGGTTQSIVDTIYDSCGCSPTGKMKQTSLPYAPGASTKYWTVNTYDGIGRTLSTVGPDGASTTTYVYEGNTVKVTDPAGKWKKFTMDAFGNLVQVNEPNPAGGADYLTTYTYDVLGHLTGVSMPRSYVGGTYAQPRTFNYSNGPLLLSKTEPETGTVNYTYNADSNLTSKVDAKNQKTEYSYDSYKRVSQVRHSYFTSGSYAEDLCQRVDYTYDANSIDSSFATYLAGRLAYVQYKIRRPDDVYDLSRVGYPGCRTTITEMYSYNQGGRMLKKRLRLSRTGQADLDSTYTYDNEGRMTSVKYPDSTYGGSPITGPTYSMSYDAMGRAQTLTTGGTTITSATYGIANELRGLNGQTFSFSNYFQLTRIQGNGVDMSYAYSATNNNGKITSQTDNSTGEQVVYTYDSLQRLASATASGSTPWDEVYTYDGWGNLTDRNSPSSTVAPYHAPADWTTNRATSQTYDANGNSLVSNTGDPYDIENRLTLLGNGGYTPMSYGYAPGNKRIYKGLIQNYSDGVTPPSVTNEEVYFYSVSGQKIGTYKVTGDQSPSFQQVATNVWFGGRLVQKNGTSVGSDRLGSFGKYYPYGQEKGSGNPANGQEKFATYTRDAETGLDYADQRFHGPGTGRFMTADVAPSAHVGDPGSWNRYAYVGGDPVSRVDPSGRDWCVAWGGGFQGSPGDPSCPWDTWVPIGCPPGMSLNQWGACEIPIDLSGIAALSQIPYVGTFSLDAALGVMFSGEIPVSVWGSFALSLSGTDISQGVTTVMRVPGLVPVSIALYTLYTIWEYANKNPPVPAPWKSFPDVDKELSKDSWKFHEADQKWAEDCPPGSRVSHRTMHWNAPDGRHPFGHWDYIDCDGKSWSVWGDGTMTRAK